MWDGSFFHNGGLEEDTSETHMYSKHHQLKPMQSRFIKGLFEFKFENAYREFTMLFEATNSMDVIFKNDVIVLQLKTPDV
jgi:hypothetical protein